MTSVLRNIVSDLVEKRLWPVAVLLLAALVAAPLVLGRGGQQAVAPLPPPASGAGVPAPAAVTPSDDVRAGGVKRRPNDPFRPRGTVAQPGTPGAASGAPAGGATLGASAAPAPAGTSGATGAGGGPTASGASAAGSSPGGSAFDVADLPDLAGVDVIPVTGGGSPAPDTGTSSGRDERAGAQRGEDGGRDSWRVDLRFGPEGDEHPAADVVRLSPLPGRERPVVVFLGVQADGETALFLVRPGTTVTGDGRCVPSPANCDRLELEAGERQTVTVSGGDAEPVTYGLTVARIERVRSDDAATARASRLREDAAGRLLLRRAVDSGQVVMNDLAFSRELGLLVPSGQDPQRDGALFGGYRTDLRFGAPGTAIKRYNLARLTPLPSTDEPSFVFMGVLGDGETALFLNPQEAPASGDAVCEPSPQECQRVKLRAGRRAQFAAPTIAGGTTEYELAVDAITPITAGSPEDARASRLRESPAGRAILRKLIDEVSAMVADLSFDRSTGTLERTPPAPATAAE